MSGTRRKPIEALLAERPGPALRRVLGPWDLIALGIGSSIGAGLFSLTGIAAAESAGPAIVFSYLIAAASSAASPSARWPTCCSPSC